jgi:hypothetical protein
MTQSLNRQNLSVSEQLNQIEIYGNGRLDPIATSAANAEIFSETNVVRRTDGTIDHAASGVKHAAAKAFCKETGNTKQFDRRGRRSCRSFYFSVVIGRGEIMQNNPDNQNKTIQRIGELLSKNYPARVVEGEMHQMASRSPEELQQMLVSMERTFGQQPKEI